MNTTDTSPSSTSDLDQSLARLLGSDQGAIQDPYQLFAHLRDHAPVYRMGHKVFVSRYHDVKSVIGNPADFGNDFQGETEAIASYRETLSPEHRRMFDEVKSRERLFLTETDGDNHRRRRKIAAHLFATRHIAEFAPLTQQFVDEVIEVSLARGAADIDYCSWRVPAAVMSTLLGIPLPDIEMVVGWCDHIEAFLFGATGLRELEASYHAHQAIEAYVLQMLADHRSGRRPTQLMEALLAAEDGELLTEAEVANTVLHAQLAGFETTRVLLSGGVYELLGNRSQWERLVADPSLAASATEELLRFTSPGQWTGRVPLRETVIGDETVGPGDTILVLLAAANRDPAVFDDPNTLDITRPNARQHLSLGHGVHHCLGHALARLEGQIWFETLARRFPNMTLTTHPVEYVGNAFVRRLAPYDVAL